jgi:hypothetical protein
MTLAVAASTPDQHIIPHTVPIVVLGTDALLAASPATPVQLAHACLRAGFANVVPASWGDELLATAVLRRLPSFGSSPVIQCSCPIVAHRLLTVGGDLRPVMLGLVPPPVAVARYVRTLSQPTRTRITYVGGCPGAIDESIDIRMTPDALIAMLAERDIRLEDQPRIFESVIPPDRRRFRSQPGGVPAADVLWTESGSRTLIEIDGEDFAAEIAQHLLSGKNVLLDTSARLGCVCSGAAPGFPSKQARQKITALEPPRSTIPVVDERAPVELDLAIPAAPRAPIDVSAAPLGPSSPASGSPSLSSLSFLSPGPARGLDASSLGHRTSPVRGFAPVVESPRPRVSNSSTPPSSSRPVGGVVPIGRDPEGKTLPRAYVARRRPSPRATPVVRLPAPEPTVSITTEKIADVPPEHVDFEISDATDAPEPPIGEPSFQRIPVHYVVLILVAVAVTIVASSAIAVVAGRSLNRPAASAPATNP